MPLGPYHAHLPKVLNTFKSYTGRSGVLSFLSQERRRHLPFCQFSCNDTSPTYHLYYTRTDTHTHTHRVPPRWPPHHRTMVLHPSRNHSVRAEGSTGTSRSSRGEEAGDGEILAGRRRLEWAPRQEGLQVPLPTGLEAAPLCPPPRQECPVPSAPLACPPISLLRPANHAGH